MTSHSGAADVLDGLEIYPFRQVRQQPQVEDVPGEVRRQILASRLRDRVRPGSRVAVAVGSRGISTIETLTKATVNTLRELEYQPFIVAAMGSHGGATAEGQRQLLAGYGITPENLGVPVRTEMDVVCLGNNSEGDPVYWDRNAFEADAVVTVSRVKPHTDFSGTYESGVVKMLVIGLGKREGAATHHRYGVRGLRDLIPKSVEVVLAKTRFVLGLAVVENASDKPAFIQALDLEDVLAVEPRLLEQARGLMARLPFDQLDLLVVGECGKNYSGTGLDVNVLGRQMLEGEPDVCKPKITRICLLDLSPESRGNATGIGIADLIPSSLLKKVDADVSHMNTLTACCLLRSKVPIDMPTDRECIATGVRTCWQPHRDRMRMALIPNTLELERLWVTRPLADEAKQNSELRADGAGRPLPFDSTGRLDQESLFLHSTRARRRRG